MLVQPECFAQETTSAGAHNGFTDFAASDNTHPALPTGRAIGDVENQASRGETLAFGAGAREVASAFDAT